MSCCPGSSAITATDQRSHNGVLDALGAAHANAVTQDDDAVPNAPGLYAIHADAASWLKLGLGAPPDGRPLYVGKAQASLRSRDLSTHFASGKTGQSSPRRSFAALLNAGAIRLHTIPRRLDNPEPKKWSHYALTPADDDRLTAWMTEHLRLATWSAPTNTDLVALEGTVMRHWLPPLNINGVRTPWTGHLKAARREMADNAKIWARRHGRGPAPS